MRKIVLLIAIAMSFTASGQTIEQVAKELRKQNVPHAKIVLAQARLETGNFTSRMCKQDKNLFGIKHGGKYARYSHWKDSIADYKKRISSRYSGGDYFSFLKRIGYAEEKEYIKKVRRIVNGMEGH